MGEEDEVFRVTKTYAPWGRKTVLPLPGTRDLWTETKVIVETERGADMQIRLELVYTPETEDTLGCVHGSIVSDGIVVVSTQMYDDPQGLVLTFENIGHELLSRAITRVGESVDAD